MDEFNKVRNENHELYKKEHDHRLRLRGKVIVENFGMERSVDLKGRGNNPIHLQLRKFLKKAFQVGL